MLCGQFVVSGWAEDCHREGLLTYWGGGVDHNVRDSWEVQDWSLGYFGILDLLNTKRTVWYTYV